MRNIIKVSLGVLFAGLLVFSVVTAASATDSVNSEVLDGCDHGASSKPCRPDPQPDRGKDCEVHGRVKIGGSVGGINEDHCSPVTTTTTAPTITLSPTTTTTTTAPTITESPTTTTTTCDIGTFTHCPGQPHGGPAPGEELPNSPKSLPRTGAGVELLAFAGLLVLSAGLIMRKIFRIN